MADFGVHLSQAKHNQELANKLINEPPYHDWGITAAFYSAIHYFECWLYKNEKDPAKKHTETSIPVRMDGKLRCSPHAWRETLIEDNLSKRAYKAFRFLRTSSETARYLSLHNIGQSGNKKWLSTPASEYFSKDDAKRLVFNDLKNFIEELHL